MAGKLSWEEIVNTYPNEWAMLVNYGFDEKHKVDPAFGEVVAHHSSRKLFAEQMNKIQAKSAAIRYTGPVSDGRALLCKIKK